MVAVQELEGGDQKEAEDANREDMLWRVNTEVHAPDIGVVGISCLQCCLESISC